MHKLIIILPCHTTYIKYKNFKINTSINYRHANNMVKHRLTGGTKHHTYGDL